MSNAELVGLINLLEEEFLQFDDMRVIPVFPSGIERSLDLDQDYDPENQQLHKRAGVTVVLNQREFFFPVEWFTQKERRLIHEQIDEIRYKREHA